MLKGFCGGKVFAHVEGEGDLVVLLMHGWGRSSSDFEDVFGLLSRSNSFPHLKVVGVDLPGFGSSPIPKYALSTYEYGRQMADLLVEAQTLYGKEKSVVLVGHSLGGRIALQMAAHQMVPNLGGVVLIGAPLIREKTNSKVATSIKIARKLRALGFLSEDKMEELRQRYGSEDYRNSTGVLRETLVKIVNEDYGDLLPMVKVETTLLYGELDQVTPTSQANAAARLIPRASCVFVPKVSHHLPLQAPGSVAEVILKHTDNLLGANS